MINVKNHFVLIVSESDVLDPLFIIRFCARAVMGRAGVEGVTSSIICI